MTMFVTFQIFVRAKDHGKKAPQNWVRSPLADSSIKVNLEHYFTQDNPGKIRNFQKRGYLG